MSYRLSDTLFFNTLALFSLLTDHMPNPVFTCFHLFSHALWIKGMISTLANNI